MKIRIKHLGGKWLNKKLAPRFFGLSIIKIKNTFTKKKSGMFRCCVELNKENGSQEPPPALSVTPTSVLSVCFVENGGLGDCLMLLPLLQAIHQEAPCPVRISFYARAGHLFKHLPYLYVADRTPENIPSLNSQYDVVFFMQRCARVLSASKEKVERLYPKLSTFMHTDEKLKEFPAVYGNFHLLNEFALINECPRQRQMDIFNIFNLDISKSYYLIQSNEKDVLKRFGLVRKKYITLSRGTDAVYDAMHVKLWPLDYYGQLASLLKTAFPNISLIQVGASGNYGVMSSIDMNLIGQTTFDEVAVLVKNALLHIDGEGGLVHLNHAVGGKSCVLFGPTDPRVFGYPENINLRSDVCSFACDWMVPQQWPKRCLKQWSRSASCMRALKPEMVFRAIVDELKQPSS